MKGRIYLNENIHNWEKTNLVGLKDHSDSYRCRNCGIEGNRPPLAEYVDVKNCNKEKFLNCDGSSEKVKKVVLSPRFINFGFQGGEICEVVECPDQYKDKYPNSIWIYSEQRDEPIRLLGGEYDDYE